ncbi:MAG: hypothetical protein RR844_04060 [Clostridium sp.]
MNELVKGILKVTISGSSFFLIPIVLIYEMFPKTTKGVSITSFNSVVSSLENSRLFEGEG